MLRLALRNVFRHRGRTSLTLAAIVFGVAGLVLADGFVRDVFDQLAEALIHSRTGHLQVMRAGYFESGTRSPEKFMIDRGESLRQRIAAVPGVREVMGRLDFSGLLNNGRSDWAIVGEGIESEQEARLGSELRMVAGRQLAAGDRDGAVVGEGVARALRLAPGDTVTLLVNTTDGALNSRELTVIGVFKSFSKDYDARAIRIPLAAAQDVLQAGGVSSLVVELDRTPDTARVAQTLKGDLGGSGLEVRTWRELSDFYEKAVALYARQFGILQLIVLAMVLLSVANSVNLSMFERVGEFGTMMALGNRRRQVFRLVMIENAYVGLLGAVMGGLVGILLAWVISWIGIPMPPPPNADLGYTAHVRPVAGAVAVAMLIGLAATVLAALLPAARVSRTPVADALRANY